jgi:beta-glucosidase
VIDRRSLLVNGATLAAAFSAAPAFAAKPRPFNPAFPKGFLWGAATAGHQVEGNNTTSDLWYLENLKPTIFAQPSGDAANSFCCGNATSIWPRASGSTPIVSAWNGRGSNR